MVHPLIITDLHNTEAPVQSMQVFVEPAGGQKYSNSTYYFPAHDVAKVDHHIHVRGPGVELPLPGSERGQRHHQ